MSPVAAMAADFSARRVQAPQSTAEQRSSELARSTNTSSSAIGSFPNPDSASARRNVSCDSRWSSETLSQPHTPSPARAASAPRGAEVDVELHVALDARRDEAEARMLRAVVLEVALVREARVAAHQVLVADGRARGRPTKTTSSADQQRRRSGWATSSICAPRSSHRSPRTRRRRSRRPTISIAARNGVRLPNASRSRPVQRVDGEPARRGALAQLGDQRRRRAPRTDPPRPRAARDGSARATLGSARARELLERAAREVRHVAIGIARGVAQRVAEIAPRPRAPSRSPRRSARVRRSDCSVADELAARSARARSSALASRNALASRS